MILYVHSTLICLNYVDSGLLCKFQACIMHVLMKNEPRFPGKAPFSLVALPDVHLDLSSVSHKKLVGIFLRAPC